MGEGRKRGLKQTVGAPRTETLTTKPVSIVSEVDKVRGSCIGWLAV